MVVLGGAKVTDKIKVIDRFLDLADRLLIGGAMSTTFLKAQGITVGASKVDEEGVAMAADALRKAATSPLRAGATRTTCWSPTGWKTARPRAVVAADAIPEGWMAVDIGPATAADYAGRVIAEAGTVFWNGPMGVFEMAPFAAGTRAVAEAMADCRGVTVAGGGDSVAALNKFRLGRQASTTCPWAAAPRWSSSRGRELPGVAALADK